MAYAMTKRGSLDNCITYEFMCDTIADMNAIENRYRTIGTIAIVLQGNSGLEVYIADSNKQWNALSGIGNSGTSEESLTIHICAQNEVSNGLPNIVSPDSATIYLVPAGETSGNLYEEYIYVDDAWEKFGGGNIDLSGYAPVANPVFTGSISLGRQASTTIGANSVAEGSDTTASGNSSHAEGGGVIASGDYSHAEGGSTTASGYASHAEGSGTTVSGDLSHAEGCGGTYTVNNVTYTSGAKGTADHTEGYQCLTESSQPGNHAEGYQTKATGGAAHAEGNLTKASGVNSHAEGDTTQASGFASHTEGSQTIAEGIMAHAEGLSSKAYGAYSHAEGNGTIANNNCTHTEGCDTKTYQDYAHAEGCSTTAYGAISHSEGLGTNAQAKCSHVSGKYNVPDTAINWEEWTANTSYSVGDKVKRTVNNSSTGYICINANSDASFTASNWKVSEYINYAEIIGNGTANNALSNARALDWDGNERLMGDLYVGCNANSTGGTKLARIPDPPTTDGTYTLQATVASGVITYTWIAGA